MNERRPDFKLLTEQKKTLEDIILDEQFCPLFFHRPKKTDWLIEKITGR